MEYKKGIARLSDMVKSITAHWFAVHVKSRHEHTVSARLTEAGVEVFSPVVERLSRWKDRNKLIRFPLFPCYVFVHIPGTHHDKLTVLKVKGVIRFLGSTSGEPESIPEEQIISLKTAVESKVSIDPYPYLQEGQRVRVKRGPLSGVEGVLIERAGQHKLILSVDILCQSTAVTIHASEVEDI
jgi:transcriptional antiterminator NusG